MLFTSTLTCSNLLTLICFDSGKKALTTFRQMHVLHTNVDLLWNDTVSYNLVYTYTYGSFGDIEDAACASMIVFVRHPLVDR